MRKMVSIFENSGLVIANERSNEISDRLSQYFEKVFKHLPENTQRAYLGDMNDFSAWCDRVNEIGLTQSASKNEQIIEHYFAELMQSTLALSTIDRRLSSLSVFLDISGWPNPLKTSSLLRAHIKVTKRDKTQYQDQAYPLQLEFITQLNKITDETKPLEVRDRLIVNIMYDCLLRASELCNILLNDIDVRKQTLHLKWSKTDQEGAGSYRFISNTTLDLIAHWREKYNVSNGYLVRKLSPKQTIQSDGVNYMSVYHTFKRITEKLGIKQSISTHSARVGSAVDMAENNIDILAIQRSGGWKSLSMPARYTAQANAMKSGASEVAKIFNR